MEDLAKILSDFGATGLWGIVLFKALECIELFGCFILIGWGIKKAWPAIQKVMEDF